MTDRGVDYTDTVNLDYAGSVDGVPFEGGTAQGQTLKSAAARSFRALKSRWSA